MTPEQIAADLRRGADSLIFYAVDERSWTRDDPRAEVREDFHAADRLRALAVTVDRADVRLDNDEEPCLIIPLGDAP